MRLGDRGEALIKSFDTLQFTSYRLSPNDPWKIGYGHKQNAYEGMTITLATADIFFNEDTDAVVKAINDVNVDLTQSMFDALVALCFDVGHSAISARATIGRAIRLGDWIFAWRGFSLWTLNPGDKLCHARRRSAEMALFLEDGCPDSV